MGVVTEHPRSSRSRVAIVSPRESSRAVKPFDPKRLSYDERYNIGALFASLVDVTGTDGERALRVLRTHFKHLGLTPSNQDALLPLAQGRHDPTRFAAAIQEDGTRRMILWDLLVLSLVDGHYDARDREGIRRVAAALGVPWAHVTAAEDQLAAKLRKRLKASAKGSKPSSGRWWKIAAATLGGGAAIALTGGLAAPAIGGAIGTYFMELSGAAAVNAGLAWLGWGAVAAGGWGMAGGTAVVSTLFGAAGGGLCGYKMGRRTGALDEFGFARLGGNGMHTYIAISGWLSQKDDFRTTWRHLPKVAQHGEHLVLRWESKHLLAFGGALASLSAKTAIKTVVTTWARRGSKLAARSLAWPTALLSLADIIDNPWHVAADRAEKAGAHLAAILSDRVGGGRPISLIGFSLGSRVIFHALEGLAKQQACGIIQHAILMGGAVTATPSRWTAARSVVAGRFVNAYSTSDWVLSLLYRAAELKALAAGLGPLECDGVENIDVTHLAAGHLAYREAMDSLLLYIGLDAPGESTTRRASRV